MDRKGRAKVKRRRQYAHMHMAYAFCDELWSAQQSKYKPPFLGILNMYTFQELHVNNRVELNMMCTNVVVVLE